MDWIPLMNQILWFTHGEGVAFKSVVVRTSRIWIHFDLFQTLLEVISTLSAFLAMGKKRTEWFLDILSRNLWIHGIYHRFDPLVLPSFYRNARVFGMVYFLLAPARQPISVQVPSFGKKELDGASSCILPSMRRHNLLL